MYSKDTDQTAYEKISALFWMKKKNLTWTYVIAFVDRESGQGKPRYAQHDQGFVLRESLYTLDCIDEQRTPWSDSIAAQADIDHYC